MMQIKQKYISLLMTGIFVFSFFISSPVFAGTVTMDKPTVGTTAGGQQGQNQNTKGGETNASQSTGALGGFLPTKAKKALIVDSNSPFRASRTVIDMNDDKNNKQLGTGLIFSMVTSILTLITYLLGILAVFIIVLDGISIITAGTETDTRTKKLEKLPYIIGGLITAILSDTIVTTFYGEVQDNASMKLEKADITTGITALASYMNFFLGFVATVAIAYMIYGGFLYITAGEDGAKKAKSIIFESVAGIVIIISSYTIVSIFIT